MRSEMKFALFFCIVCSLILVLSMPLQDGWLIVLVIQYLGFPLVFLAGEIASRLGLQFPMLNMFIIVNINVFIITYTVSKSYFSLKSFIKVKLSRKK